MGFVKDTWDGITGKTGAEAAGKAGEIQSQAAKEAAGITSEAALKVAEMQAQTAREAGGIAGDAYTQASQMQAKAIQDAAKIQQASQLEAAGLLSDAQRQALGIAKQQFAQTQQQFQGLYSQLAPAQQVELQGLQRQEQALGGQAQLATGAQGQLGSLLGIGGAEAQQQAQSAILDSPAMQALRERAGMLSTRTSAAIGGLGGGNVRQELYSQGRALDEQALQQRINQLSGVSQFGTQGIGQTATGIGAGAIGQQVAMGMNQAQLLGGMTSDIGRTLAAGAAGAGQAQAGGVLGAGEALSGGMLGTGQARANALTGATNAIGTGQLASSQALAQGLTGGAQATAAGLLGGAQAQAQGMQNLLSAGTTIGAAILSDPRTKENIEKIGELSNGLGVYRYNYLWNKAKTIGVMANEVKRAMPDAIGDLFGFMTVDYGRVLNAAR